MCYTDYVIDFRKFIWTPMYWPMAPALNTLELLNYFTLTFRMDRNAKFPSIETSRELWNWRPIVFSVFHLITFVLMLYFPVSDAITANMIQFDMLFTVAMIVSVYYYFKLLMSEKWYEKFMPFSFGNYLGLMGSIVVTFLMMFVFVTAICPAFIAYLMVLSYFVIFVFNGFWPPSVYSVYNQIFQELKEAPVSIDKPTDTITKLKNAAFQHSHSIYLFFILCIFLGKNIYDSMSFANQSLIVIAIITNLLICALFAPSVFFELPFVIIGILMEGSREEKPIIAPEGGGDVDSAKSI